MANTNTTEQNDWLTFHVKGFEYRTNGKIVEGHDGKSWNQTGSLSIWLEAQKLYNASK